MLSNLQQETTFLSEQLKLKDDHFRNEISYIRKQLEECLYLPLLKRDDHDFISYRKILNLLLKISIATTDQPPRDSNSINNHNDGNKSSAVSIIDNDRDVNNNSVKERNRIETNKNENSNSDSNNNKSGRWDGNANEKAK